MFNDEDYNAVIKRRNEILKSQIPSVKIGDVFVLNSGGPEMTVAKSVIKFEDMDNDNFDETKLKEIITVKYFNDAGVILEAEFDKRCLNKI